jgi:hypothetical protein
VKAKAYNALAKLVAGMDYQIGFNEVTYDSPTYWQQEEKPWKDWWGASITAHVVAYRYE